MGALVTPGVKLPTGLRTGRYWPGPCRRPSGLVSPLPALMASTAVCGLEVVRPLPALMASTAVCGLKASLILPGRWNKILSSPPARWLRCSAMQASWIRSAQRGGDFDPHQTRHSNPGAWMPHTAWSPDGRFAPSGHRRLRVVPHLHMCLRHKCPVGMVAARRPVWQGMRRRVGRIIPTAPFDQSLRSGGGAYHLWLMTLCRCTVNA